MATLFQSFRSSSMPKRLLRYALAKLELLDAEALDMDNLDFAIGRNTVFEFRDAGIKLKKLEKLLQLPPALRLQKAKVILLRVTIPVDFYTSPILVEVDGVDVRLQVLGPDRKPAQTRGTKTPADPKAVPNTVDLAQSFLDAQPSSERKELEEALAAETQDLGASVTVSDDGSSEDEPVGTGQPLSLPSFLADFLQGIVDRMQVRIKNVTFQLDVDVPMDGNSSTPEPVSFQIALEDVDVEGVTAQIEEKDDPPTFVHREGKRHVSLNNVRAYLISEANVFSALVQSPSILSPSLSSSPALTRNPPTRESTMSENDNLHNLNNLPVRQESSFGNLSDTEDSEGSEDIPLGDSEEALGIPYDLSQPDEDQYDDGPATPRASIYHGFDASPEQSMFHSTILPQDAHARSTAFGTEAPQWASAQLNSRSEPTILPQTRDPQPPLPIPQDPEAMPQSVARSDDSSEGPMEDLTQSHLYTHEDAESMYMSAFSSTSGKSTTGPSPPPREASPLGASTLVEESKTKDNHEAAMPGGWDDEYDSSPKTEPQAPSLPSETPEFGQEPKTGSVGKTEGLPSNSEGEELPTGETEAQASLPGHGVEQDDVATPKGPTKLVKQFLVTKTISLYIPSQHHHIEVQPASAESVANLSHSLGGSVYPQAPGAFSVHGGSSSLPRDPQPSEPAAIHEDDRALEVEISPISLRFDASFGFLLSMVVGKLMSAIKPEGQPSATQKEQASNSQTGPDIKLNLQEISVDFLNQLAGVADTLERHLDPNAFNLDNEVLLNTTLQNLSVSMSHTDSAATKPREGMGVNEALIITKVELEKFRFGYANDDIISFDKARPMSTSVRDTFLSSGHDIGLKIMQSNGNVRTDIETLPLVIRVDLQRLDETFGWFGGLSSFLNMSTSMASIHSPVPKQAPLPKPKPRGVRFESPLDPNNKTAVSESKVNLRVGGAWVELLGKECSVSAESSAVKLVSRDEGIGIAISFLRLSGPHLKNSLADPAITAEVGGVRLDYLTTPKDADLERLLELITPSKANFDEGNDEIMVDTLLRQRRKGSVLRANVETLAVRVKNTAQLVVLPNLGDEIAKLSTVAKYLPEDDRPGLLTLGRIQKINASVDCGGQLGQFDANLDHLEIGHISMPSLVAVSAHGLSLKRNEFEELVSSSIAASREGSSFNPVIMARMIGDEIEPIIKLKLQNMAVEYRVPFVMDILGLGDDATPQDFEASLAASVANLGDQAQTALRQPREQTEKSKPKSGNPMTLDVGFKDFLIGLNPLNLPSKMILALTDAHLEVVLPKDVETKAVLSLDKSSILLVDDVAQATQAGSATKSHRRTTSTASRQVNDLCAQGFVDICYISSAKVVVNVMPGVDDGKQVEVDARDDLLVLETCADSTQTLITLVNALKPPTPPSKEIKYRTNVMPMQDLLASISAEAFGRPEGEYDFDQDFAGAQEMAGSGSDADFASDGSLGINSRYYGEQQLEGEEIFDAMNASNISFGSSIQDTEEGVLLSGPKKASSAASEDSSDDLVIHDDFYAPSGPSTHQTAKIWNSSQNSYDRAPEKLVKHSPLKLTLRDSHFIWNLFDGYDWAHTRDVISKAVYEVESKAMERQNRSEGANIYEEEIEDEEAIGDFLFNSIYIGIPANRDPQELARAINEELQDNATETESIATTAFTGTTNRTARPHQPKSRRLRLSRSKHHKITFELQGVNVDLFAFPADNKGTESCVDVRIKSLDIFDHVPSSTWKKFATYDQDHGEREMGAPMVHLEILNVKPLSDLPVSEIVLRASVLPLRLHVDQDALDFITRFFEFKDENVPVHSSPSDVPFIQRAEVNSIPLKLDFKPKRVDYAGLRSGHTSEFMNFIVLEESTMVLRHAIIYGVSGFDRLGKTLNDLWTPDVKNNQLPGVIAGLAPVRSLVNIGSGFKDLVEIPIKEYQKDGRVIRSISKGAAAFARTTGTEIVKLGAKLAVGTQYALQGAEEMFTERPQHGAEGTWDEEDLGPEEKKQISLYADPPPSVLQGLRGGYRSLARDVNMARDAIIAVPGEIMQSQSPGGAAKAVWKRAPTIVFRPAVGVTKVIGQTLMGATNAMDPEHRRRVDEKYKKH
ncbi:autophagy- protein 2 [Amphichorda felina]